MQQKSKAKTQKTNRQGFNQKGALSQNKKPAGKKENLYTMQFKANKSDVLLEFLLRKCKTSRNNVKSLLAKRQVLINGSVVTQFDFPLTKDDEVKISKNPITDGISLRKNSTQNNSKACSPKPITILYEDDDFIVIHKPEGLLSVESDKERESAYSYLLADMQMRDKTARPFILHRIDKETSGVLVFAKNIKIHSMLKLHWNELVTLREYYAVVEGIPEEKQKTIISYLKENKNNLMYSVKDSTGQKAITHYTVENQTTDYALLKVKIDTGRKNQIRVHMQDIGHPIVMDEKYGYTKNPLGRLGLHASTIAFIHPITKKVLTFTAPLPKCFKSLFHK